MPITCEEMNSVRQIKARLDREQHRIQDLEILAKSNVQHLDGMPHAKPLSSKVEQFVMLMDECQKSIDSLAEQLVQAKFNLLCRLQAQQLSELLERVLSYHYVACLSLGEIARLMHYTRDYIWKLRNKGLKALGLSLDEMKRSKSTFVQADSFDSTSPAAL